MIYDQKHVWNEFLKTFDAHHDPAAPFLAFSPSRALLAAMARRAGTTRPKATARLQQPCIRSHAV